MKRRLIRFVALIFALVMLLSACSSSQTPSTSTPVSTPSGSEVQQTDPVVTLKFCTDKPATHTWSVLDQQWIDLVYEMSNGTIIIEPYFNDTLVASASAYTETVAGVTDIIMVTAGKETEHFIVESRIKYFLWGVNDRDVYYQIVTELFEQCEPWRAEYEGVHLLGWDTTGELQIQSAVEINSLADVTGLSLRVTDDRTFGLMTKLGASPIKMPNSELYESMSKNVIQGTLVPTEALKSTGIGELCECSYLINWFAGWEIMRYINEDSWNKLTENQQQILTEACEERARWQAEANAADGEWTLASREYAEGEGVVFKEATEADYALMNTYLEELALEIVEELNGLGYDGDGIYALARSIVEKYTK